MSIFENQEGWSEAKSTALTVLVASTNNLVSPFQMETKTLGAAEMQQDMHHSFLKGLYLQWAVMKKLLLKYCEILVPWILLYESQFCLIYPNQT